MTKIAIIMGSESDLKIMNEAVEVVKSFDQVPHVEIVSAHRTPLKMVYFCKQAKSNNIQVIIAGAGGAAHLPGMVASMTTLPVIGVPIKSSNSIEGIDSLLSIVQMPGGIPVATMAVNGAKNAGLLAVRILALNDGELSDRLDQYKKDLELKVKQMNERLGQKMTREQ